jgi:hypothetical protein
MLAHGHSIFGLVTDYAVLTGTLIVVLLIAAQLYPRVAT